MFIVVSQFIFRYFTPSSVGGITIFPFIFIKHPGLKEDATFINHEKIHIRQQAELLIVFFYLAYIAEYLYLLIKYKNKVKAYEHLSFEREAYENESDFNYLKTRKPFSFIKYW
jgi:hypothetical protein